MANKKSLEIFELKKIKRSELKEAEYNPRKMKEKAYKKLEKFIKSGGLLQPAIIFNKITGNIISGHQRLKILDSYYNTDNYEITASIVNLTKEEEIKANIKLNNESLMGSWDEILLQEIKMDFPEIDFDKDLGFEKLDLEYIFKDNILAIEQTVEQSYNELNEIKQHSYEDIEKLKEAKARERSNRKQENRNNKDYDSKYDDYCISFIFETSKEKQIIMSK